MASLSYYAQRDCFKVNYTLRLPDNRIRKTKYFKTRDEGRFALNQLGLMETAVKNGVASQDNIEGWITKRWMSMEEAEQAFHGFEDSLQRKEKTQFECTDYAQILLLTRNT